MKPQTNRHRDQGRHDGRGKWDGAVKPAQPPVGLDQQTQHRGPATDAGTTTPA